MSKPDFTRPELLSVLPAYQLVRDCYHGELAVKGRTTYYATAYHHTQVGNYNGGGSGISSYAKSTYLPDPSPASEPADIAQRRYETYVDRAVFYNVTKRTIKGMVGAVFAKYPVVSVPDAMAYLDVDVDGSGQTLGQQAKLAMTECLITGRGGLLADMPVSTSAASQADVKGGKVRPIIVQYGSESIINWRYRRVGALNKLSLVVLSESYVESDDGFEQETGEQLLVLRLDDDNLATSQIYKKSKDGEWVAEAINNILDSSGARLDTIPFYPFGAVNNDLDIDDIPMYDIAHLNIAHFRDSADYQESMFIAGQPTLVVSGLTQQWVNEVLKDGISIGSRSAPLLPVGANAQLLQAATNGALMESMQHKEAQMTALGAKLIEEGGSTKTATEAAQDNAEESNTLTNIAYNISDAYTKAAKMCASYMGYDDADIVVTLNTNFSFAKMTPEQRQQLMAEWQGGAITWQEYRAALVESEIATIEDAEDARKAIESEQGVMTTEDRL